ncbi:MAG: type II secretion system major pseudopilin GspG [Thermodesulfobacteriota bacterium]|nr:type II secretion system major pseudopilin GspG [Thermodesulfobacteriota bacterium]
MVRSDKGFTFIELMVVLVILGILAGLIMPRIMGRPEQARRLKARIQIQNFEQALNLYYLDNGFYPTTEQGLMALVEIPTIGKIPSHWKEGGYLEKGKVPKDPWGNSYIYISPGVYDTDGYDIESYGSDGEDGGEGKNSDIESWNLEKEE